MNTKYESLRIVKTDNNILAKVVIKNILLNLKQTFIFLILFGPGLTPFYSVFSKKKILTK